MNTKQIAEHAIWYLSLLGINSVFLDGRNVRAFADGLTYDLDLSKIDRGENSDVDIAFAIHGYAHRLHEMVLLRKSIVSKFVSGD